ncbi:hypothetical protein [Paenibacillus pabuli]|uniref:hypothetical protein n=1 Tax=Paenibacillus pabuli TaxID=1472 RepID=UPI001FFF18DE|nr:hypothetical protein [Paenibacillus pabuli]UPK45755.1 hypothetical protein KET34_10010 [Paenibacillus pabuli]
MSSAIPITTQPVALPIMRESVVVPIYDGEKTVRVSVYKDELESMIKRSMGFGISPGRQA